MNFIPLKDNHVFSVTNNYGDILPSYLGSGIYYQDTRFLQEYEMLFNDQPCIFLKTKQNEGVENVFVLSNGDIQAGDSHYEKMDLEIVRKQLIYQDIFYDKVKITNGSQKHIQCTLTLSVKPSFEDIFEVRGAKRKKRGKDQAPVIEDRKITYSYVGLDDLVRSVSIYGCEGVEIDQKQMKINLDLSPGESQSVEFAINVYHNKEKNIDILPYDKARELAIDDVRKVIMNQTVIKTDNEKINKTLKQSNYDLNMLMTDIGYGSFPVAGIPWFSVPFGRDSMITALQSMLVNPEYAKNTLRTLAELQGKRESDWNEERPGKILHEQRNGEMANLDEVPFKKYYGSVDGTPLFIILFAETIKWTGDEEFLYELLPSVERALEYLEDYGDLDEDLFVEFHKESAEGLAVQSWKDSNSSMVHKDGTPSFSPIAPVEVQGYLYDAKQKMAEIYEKIGNQTKASKLREESAEVKTKFNNMFWMENENYFALALDRDKKQIQTVTSNPGHALWSNIIDKSKSRQVADRLLLDDLFSGWGIRTMSNKEKVYSPIAYHNGTVWPHDNSLILLGLANYGFSEHISKLSSALFDSATQFSDNRLPELFCGYDKKEETEAIPFSVACSPQAWAAGTPFSIIQSLLGMKVDSLNGKVEFNVVLPEGVNRLEVNKISMNKGVLSIRIERQHKEARFEILENSTELEVMVSDKLGESHE